MVAPVFSQFPFMENNRRRFTPGPLSLPQKDAPNLNLTAFTLLPGWAGMFGAAY
jgi:hypothetical protein